MTDTPDQHDDRAPAGNARPRTSPADALGLFARGVAMGAADVVPGVSGGTIAFITGIYERFVNALRSLSPKPAIDLVRKGPRAGAASLMEIHWGTLLPIGAGIVLAIVALSKLILGLMETRPGPTYALFFGLIAASAWVPIARIKKVGPPHIGAILVAAIGAFLLVGLTPSGSSYEVTRTAEGAAHALALDKVRSAGDYRAMSVVMPPDVSHVYFDPKGVTKGWSEPMPEGLELVVLNDEDELTAFVAEHPSLTLVESIPPALPYVFFCGVIAISAMILPGLSGSFLLLMLGVYASVFGAVHRVIDHLKFWSDPDLLTSLSARPAWADFALVGIFLVGVVIGLGTFSRLVHWLFERAHDLTMAALTGLMIGALRLPWDKMTDDPASAAGASYWALVAGIAIAGAGVVIGLHLVERRLALRSTAA